MELSMGALELLEHRREKHEVDEIRIELSAASFLELLGRLGRKLATLVAAVVRDGVEDVGDGDDARDEWDLLANQVLRVA